MRTLEELRAAVFAAGPSGVTEMSQEEWTLWQQGMAEDGDADAIAYAALLSRVEQLEARVASLEETRVGVDMVELIERACTCGVGAKPGGLHATDCMLSRNLRAIAMRASS